MKILVADDDPDMLDVTTYALRRHGYSIVVATDGTQAIERCESERPDLLLLDVGLPRMNGFEVCRKVRESSGIPIIMLTARADDDNVVQGFLTGADDYVTKPFSHRQLVMRIRAVLNRTSGGLHEEPATHLDAGDLHLDLESHEVTKSGQTIRLTPLEFRILHILALNYGRVVNSRRLVEYAWGYDGGEPSLLKTHISHIRQKLGMDKADRDYIKAIPWVGYALARD